MRHYRDTGVLYFEKEDVLRRSRYVPSVVAAFTLGAGRREMFCADDNLLNIEEADGQ